MKTLTKDELELEGLRPDQLAIMNGWLRRGDGIAVLRERGHEP